MFSLCPSLPCSESRQASPPSFHGDAVWSTMGVGVALKGKKAEGGGQQMENGADDCHAVLFWMSWLELELLCYLSFEKQHIYLLLLEMDLQCSTTASMFRAMVWKIQLKLRRTMTDCIHQSTCLFFAALMFLKRPIFLLHEDIHFRMLCYKLSVFTSYRQDIY